MCPFFGLKEVSSSLPGSQWERIAVMKISPQNIYYTLYAQTKSNCDTPMLCSFPAHSRDSADHRKLSKTSIDHPQSSSLAFTFSTIGEKAPCAVMVFSVARCVALHGLIRGS